MLNTSSHQENGNSPPLREAGQDGRLEVLIIFIL
jgi:hypothetical protein